MKTVYALCALALLTSCQPKPPKFQVFDTQGGHTVIKLDTETGQSWKYESGIWTPIITVPTP
jgi:hypothetical protein